MEKTIKVLLVDDSEVVRLGLRSLLSMYPFMDVVGEAASGKDAVNLAISHRPDVVLMDIRMPDQSGIEACKEILTIIRDTSVIMLTSYDDDEAIYDSIMAGASGYVLKEISAPDLINAIRQVANGKSLLDPAITTKLLKRIRNSEEARKISKLTEQEKQVLAHIAMGKTNRQIAAAMVLSEKTVRNYVTQVLAKLELNNRAEAAAFAVRYRLD